MKEPIIREAPIPVEKPSLGPSSLRSLRAAVRSLKPSNEPSPPPNPSGVKRRRWRPAMVGALAVAGIALAVWWESDGDTFRNNAEPVVVSGSPRLKMTRSGNYIRWHAREVELSIDPSVETLGPTANDAVLLAFDAWRGEHPALPALTIDRASASREVARDGVNLVTFAPIEIPQYRRALAVTIAYTQPDGEISEADIVINARSEFGTLSAAEHERSDDRQEGHGAHDGCRNRYDLQSVVTHEAGHFLGLGEDEVETQATMYYKTSRCDTKQRDLDSGDIEAVRTVYDQPLTDDDEAAPGCSLGNPRTTGTPPLLLLATFGLALRRRLASGRRTPATRA